MRFAPGPAVLRMRLIRSPVATVCLTALLAAASSFGCHSLDREPNNTQHFAAPQQLSPPSNTTQPTPGLVVSTTSNAAAASSTASVGHPDSRLPLRSAVSVPQRPCRIAVLGDSLTDPKSGGGGYLTVLQRQCPTCAIDNFGKGASMVVQMRRRFEKVVEPVLDRYSHLIVFGGVNDVYSDETAGRTPDKIERDLAQIYERAHAGGTRVVAINVSPWGGFKRYFNKRRGAATLMVNAWLEQQQQEGNVDYLVDAYAVLSCGIPDRLCPHFEWPFKDGIHFGPSGHEVLGRQLVSAAFSTCPDYP